MRFFFLILTFLGLKLATAHALPEDQVRPQFQDTLIKFYRDHGKTFVFEGEGALLLQAIRFVHTEGSAPDRGTIVLLPGRSEPYLKYLEVFYDLYQQGYDLYSYDHRGQGLSPHLSSRNEQIGHIDDFLNYVDDVNTFTETQVKPRVKGPLYMLAHSMGGGIAARYLIEHPGNYNRAVLSAPMLDINTSPYPHAIAKLIVSTATRVGLGNRYAIGYGDYVFDQPIDQNLVTHSAERAWMADEITRLTLQGTLGSQDTRIGGPSNRWVLESLQESKRTRKLMSHLETPTLMFQAGRDALVLPGAEAVGCDAARQCGLHVFPESKHEILMERDPIRNEAMSLISDFLVTQSRQ